MNITGAIFDMDGTLIDSLYIWTIIWNKLGERYLGDPTHIADPAFESKLHTIPFGEVVPIIKEHYRLSDSTESILAYFNEIINEFYRTRVSLKPGAREWLEHLHRNGVKMCIASASNREWIETALKRCNAEKYFCRILNCNEVGKNKSFPDIYEQSLLALGTPKDSTWVFEDAPVALQTASDFGLKTVGISDPAEPNQTRVKSISTHYIAPGEGMDKLIRLSFLQKEDLHEPLKNET